MSNADRQWTWRQKRKAEGLTTHPNRAPLTPDQRKSKREAYKLAHPEKVKERKVAYKQAHYKYKLPFAGCDGEGAGKDDLGRQLYMLFRMGDRELYTGEPLRTADILDFICSAPRGLYYVGFSFGYDVTMILRDLSDDAKKRVCAPRTYEKGQSPFVWFGRFEVDYLPKQYLRVRRVTVENGRAIPVRGSTRTIYETFGFFQKAFLKVLQQFEIGTHEDRERIRLSKDQRGSDDWKIDAETRAYCDLECRFLAEVMEKLRDNCFAANIRPTVWSGAGKLAKSLLSSHQTPRMSELNIPKEAEEMASMGYYGGRFEVTRVGFIQSEVHEYDIRSAYPSAMRDLPCLLPEHGRWLKASTKDLSGEGSIGFARGSRRFAIASVSFSSSSEATGPLPIRSKEGVLYWPRRGRGIYFSEEIASAERMGCDIRYHRGWVYEQTCGCQPFGWVEEVYEYRKALGSDAQGYPIKLGVNALYGSLAQRVGSGKYSNMVWAGLITAYTRAMLNDVARQAPNDVVMFATDAVYSTAPLNLPISERLGQWEHKTLEDLFIVQPGLYWDASKTKRKSRGLSGKFFEQEERTQAFETAWLDYLYALNSNLQVDYPSASVPVTNFIGLKLAASRGKHETAGCWKEEQRTISFDPRRKREPDKISGHALLTKTRMGTDNCFSLPHRDFLKSGGHEAWDRAKLEFEEQPDFVDLSSPWSD